MNFPLYQIFSVLLMGMLRSSMTCNLRIRERWGGVNRREVLACGRKKTNWRGDDRMAGSAKQPSSRDAQGCGRGCLVLGTARTGGVTAAGGGFESAGSSAEWKAAWACSSI